jgi:alpha/beta superfamily hydrolase
MTAAAPSPCRFVDPVSGRSESIEYLDVGGSQVYTVLHSPAKPAAAVLLCGPVSSERARPHRTLVDLARAIADAGFLAMRFDYRGMGESTGRFEDFTLTDWHSDVAACARHLAATAPGVPLALWGIRAGALLASECFREGLGDAAMFCAPASGRDMLNEILRRSFVADALAGSTGRRRSREELIGLIEGGATVSVDGYPWSARLWADAARHPAELPPATETRPWRVVEYRRAARNSHAPGADHLEIDSGERFWEGAKSAVTRAETLQRRVVGWLRTVEGRARSR